MSSTLFRSCFPYHANITIKNKSAIKNIIPNPLIIEIQSSQLRHLRGQEKDFFVGSRQGDKN